MLGTRHSVPSTATDLPFVHLGNTLDANTSVCPVDIPVVVVAHLAKIQAFGRTTDTFVFAHRDTDEIDSAQASAARRKENGATNLLRFFLFKSCFFSCSIISDAEDCNALVTTRRSSSDSPASSARDGQLSSPSRWTPEWFYPHLRVVVLETGWRCHRLGGSIPFSVE